MTPDTAWAALDAALDDCAPACVGLSVFTADRLTDREASTCASIYARCDVESLCDAYTTVAHPEAGYWAGHFYSPKGKR